MYATLALSLLLLDGAPRLAGYGFNWLDPASECKRLDEQHLAKAGTCEATANAFGLDLPARTCKVSAKVEWVVYDTAEHCRQAWETMQANGD